MAVALFSTNVIPWKKASFSSPLNHQKSASPRDNHCTSVWRISRQNIKTMHTQVIIFNQNYYFVFFYYFIRAFLRESDLFNCEVMIGVAKIRMTSAISCNCLVSCSSASSVIHHQCNDDIEKAEAKHVYYR